MREILFRGKTKVYNKWVYGWYCGKILNHNMHYTEESSQIIDDKTLYWHTCEPDTVGQFTGLTDKNGKKIFEGDIIEWFLPELPEYPSLAYIEYDESSFAWRVCWRKYDPDWLEGLNKEYISVIGNIHDNPELL